jgi:hypothetical protein
MLVSIWSLWTYQGSICACPCPPHINGQFVPVRDSKVEGTTTGIINQHSAGEWHAGEYMVLTDLSRVNLCLSMISFPVARGTWDLEQ